MSEKVKLGIRKVSWSKKQIVLPEAVVYALELEEGDSVAFVLIGGEIRLEKVKP